jgi:predicted SprT family Zn-dependent metalloprotease
MNQQPTTIDNQMSDLAPAPVETKALQKLYDALNKGLFDESLPRPMLLFSRNANIIGGYFSPDKWTDDNGNLIHEIALNANVLSGGDLPKIVMILAHEMIHLEQHHTNQAPRPGYHDRNFAARCRSIGIIPKGPDGKETGQALGGEIELGGRLETLLAELPDEILFPWLPKELPNPDSQLGPPTPGQAPPPPPVQRPGTRSKYSCPVCGINVWGKHGLSILCATDNQLLIDTNQPAA